MCSHSVYLLDEVAALGPPGVAPRMDTAMLVAEILYGTPVRVPGLCFEPDVAQSVPAARQLQLARDNTTKYLPPKLDSQRFKHSPFVSADLKKCQFVYLRDDTLAKAPLAPRYSGPFKILDKNWGNNTFTIQVDDRREVVSLGRLKAAAGHHDWGGTVGPAPRADQCAW